MSIKPGPGFGEARTVQGENGANPVINAGLEAGRKQEVSAGVGRPSDAVGGA